MFVVLALLSAIMVLTLFTSCESPIEAKALVIVNDSDSAIDYIQISQYVSGARITSDPTNALAEGETIAVGESRTFYLAPYVKEPVYLYIKNSLVTSAGIRVEFTYDYLVDGKNEAITATYDGSEITYTGSNSAAGQVSPS